MHPAQDAPLARAAWQAARTAPSAARTRWVPYSHVRSVASTRGLANGETHLSSPKSPTERSMSVKNFLAALCGRSGFGVRAWQGAGGRSLIDPTFSRFDADIHASRRRP